jgi:hypothetical protein
MIGAWILLVWCTAEASFKAMQVQSSYRVQYDRAAVDLVKAWVLLL